MRLAEVLGVGGVGDLAVERHDVAAARAERGQRLAVGLAGGDLLAELPRRQLGVGRLEAVRLAAGGRRELARAGRARRRAPRSPASGSSSGLPCLPGWSSTALTPRPFIVRATIAVGRLADRLRLGVGALDRLDVVAVDRDRVPAEGLQAAHVGVEVPAQHRLARLAEAVDVEDRDQVVEALPAGVLDRLPHRALGHLAVAAQAPDAERQAVEPLAGQRDAGRDRQALAERAGGHVGGRDARGRVALEPRAELAEGQQLLVVDPPGRLEHRVVERRRVALGEDQVVVGVAQVPVDEDGDQVGRRHRRGGVAGAGGGAGADRVHAQLLPQLPPELGPSPMHAARAGRAWPRGRRTARGTTWRTSRRPRARASARRRRSRCRPRRTPPGRGARPRRRGRACARRCRGPGTPRPSRAASCSTVSGPISSST